MKNHKNIWGNKATGDLGAIKKNKNLIRKRPSLQLCEMGGHLLSAYKGREGTWCAAMLQAPDPHVGFLKEAVAFAQMDFQEFGGESSEGDTEDLDSLKVLTEKLKLQTRRPSYLEWQERLQRQPWTDGFSTDGLDSGGQVVSIPAPRRIEDTDVVVGSICGFDTIDDALEHLRKELVRDREWCAHSLYTLQIPETYNSVDFSDTCFFQVPPTSSLAPVSTERDAAPG